MTTMKKLIFLATLFSSLFATQTAMAQNPITTLEHAGTTTVFYGTGSLVDAYTASVNGDYLYLSTGFFTAPAAIAKGVKIIGAGHFPDSASVTKRTYILNGLTINAGADSLRLEGMYINGDINYAAASSINYVNVVRCRLGSALFNSSSAIASKNYCSYVECLVVGDINFSLYGTNLLIKNSLVQGQISHINGGALIDENLFLRSGWSLLANVNSSSIQNNVIIYNNPGYNDCISGSIGNVFNNNLFVKSDTNLGANSSSNNYMGVAQANIFVNQLGNTIDYTQDYHLKSPTTYLGTDGTQVGIYGGDSSFKEKGMPSNPQITSKSVDRKTDSNGNLKINFTVKAQDN